MDQAVEKSDHPAELAQDPARLRVPAHDPDQLLRLAHAVLGEPDFVGPAQREPRPGQPLRQLAPAQFVVAHDVGDDRTNAPAGAQGRLVPLLWRERLQEVREVGAFLASQCPYVHALPRPRRTLTVAAHPSRSPG